MATYAEGYSGYTGGSGQSAEFRLRGVIERTDVSIANNTSTVRVRYWVESKSGAFNFNSFHSMWFDGVNIAQWNDPRSVGWQSSVLVADTTRTITHSADGSRGVGAGMGFSNPITGSMSLDVVLYLDTIPRSTTPDWSGAFTTSVAKTINLPRASAGFTHDVYYKFGSNARQTIATGAGTSASWTPQDSLATNFINAASGSGIIQVVTKNGSTIIGTKDVGFTLNLNSSIKPTVDTVLWDDDNPTVKSNIGAFVQSISLVKGSVSSTGVYASTISTERLVINGTAIPEGSTLQVGATGTITASGEAVDSRGRLGSKTANFNVLPYSPPVVTNFLVARSNSVGTLQDDGAYLKLTLEVSATGLVVSAVEKNALSIVVKTRPKNGAWTTRQTIQPGLSYNSSVLISGGAIYLPATSYSVRVELGDRTGSSYLAETTVATGTVTLDLNGTNVGIGKFNEQGALDVAGDGYAENWRASENIYVGSAVLCPVGSVFEWYTGDIPLGYLLLNGQAVLRSIYPKLFALWGVTFGAGNGTTTFNVVDRRGRVGVGVSSDTEFNSLGKTHGAKTHKLTASQLPSHQHGFIAGSHSFLWGQNGSGVVHQNSGQIQAGAPPSNNMMTLQNSWNKTNNDGGGNAEHNNIQPSIASHFIVRAM
jgi:microcystin-dependent protein